MNRSQRRKAGYVANKAPLDIKMAVQGEQVVIEFSEAVRWIGMGVTHAEEFIAKLQGHVDELKVNALSAERSHE